MTGKEMWVRCGDCEHRWIAVHLPMTIEKVTAVMKRLICPQCAKAGKIYVCEAATQATHVSVGSGGGPGRISIKPGGGSIRGHITIPAGGPKGWAGEAK